MKPNLRRILFDMIQNSDIKSLLDQSEQFMKGSFAFLDLQMKTKYSSVGFFGKICDRTVLF